MPNFLIVRGDLRSHTGYSKALRALLRLLEPHFDFIGGVDIHFSASKSTAEFPYHLVADHQIMELISRGGSGRTLILHFTTPDGFVPFRGAHNVGYFFWETDRFRPDLFWTEAIRTMDEMWVPSRFMFNLLRNHGYSGPMTVITWPHDFSAPLTGELPATLQVQFVVRSSRSGAESNLTSELHRLGDLAREYSPIYLSILTDAPRKGLPMLLAGWAEYLRNRQTKSLLLLKLSSVDIARPDYQLRDEILDSLSSLVHPAVRDLDVALLFGSVSDATISGLYALSDAYLTATMGEGFGGPVIESILHGKPFLSPRHTSLEDLIPPDYPFILASEETSVILPGNVPVYSLSSRWHVVSPNAITDALLRFDETSAEERLRAVSTARSFAARFCSKDHVAKAISEAMAHQLSIKLREDKAKIPVGSLGAQSA